MAQKYVHPYRRRQGRRVRKIDPFPEFRREQSLRSAEPKEIDYDAINLEEEQQEKFTYSISDDDPTRKLWTRALFAAADEVDAELLDTRTEGGATIRDFDKDISQVRILEIVNELIELYKAGNLDPDYIPPRERRPIPRRRPASRTKI